MYRRTLFTSLLCVVALFATAVPVEAGIMSTLKRAVGLQKKEPKRFIKVLVASHLDGAMVEVTGAYNIFDPANNARLGTRFTGKSMFMQPMENGIKWGEEFPFVYQLELRPDESSTSVLINGQQYHGSLIVYNIEGQLHVVNKIDVEEYVRDTLAAQFQDSTPAEVLSAVAIAQRTHAYYLVDNYPQRFFNVKAEEVNYQGHAVFNLHDEVYRAVDSTRGVVMLNEVHAPFAATWTEHSAGRTAPYHLMFRKNAGAPVRSVETPFAARDKAEAFWQTAISLDQLAHIAQLPQVSNLHLFTDQESGKVYGARVEGSAGSAEFSFRSLREAVGPELQSSMFTAQVEGDEVVFRGYGKGAGVGICLYEAKEMADRGKEAPVILEHFFPGTKIKYVDTPKVKSSVARSQKGRIHQRLRRQEG